MCELMKSEPVEDQIPMEISDLLYETQLAFDIYNLLPSKWDTFGGNYMGKDFTLMPTLFKHFDVEKNVGDYIWKIIPIIDNFVAEDVAQKIKARSKSKGDMPSGGRNS